MKMQKLLIYTLGLYLASCFMGSCSEENVPENPQENTPGNESAITLETQCANVFAQQILNYYYYWNEEIAKDLNLLNPDTNSDPIKTVEEIRYHEGNTLIDKWTMLTDDMEEFTSSVGGVSTTYGYQPKVYLLSQNSKECVAAVAFVYKDSPAEKAGLKRGDIIYQINGKQLTTDNYLDLYYSSSIELGIASMNEGNVITPTGNVVSMNAVEMYEDPIICDSVYEFNGKKVGYLAYSSFDLKSIPGLIEISKKFKSEGVKELILDLRYNGGGYVITEGVMASMYAPQQAVDNEEIFELEDYNKELTEYFKSENIDNATRFTTEHQIDKNTIYSTKDANIGLEKIYGIITGNSASASEALLGGLMPYMDIELIGEQSHGKYCTGWMISAKDAYEEVPEPIKNWGIYVMVSIYKNANGETPCMPDGMVPDVFSEDNPMLSEQLGDINESMLKAALKAAGMVYSEENQSRSAEFAKLKSLPMPEKPNFGKRIIIPNKYKLSTLDSKGN